MVAYLDLFFYRNWLEFSRWLRTFVLDLNEPGERITVPLGFLGPHLFRVLPTVEVNRSFTGVSP